MGWRALPGILTCGLPSRKLPQPWWRLENEKKLPAPQSPVLLEMKTFLTVHQLCPVGGRRGSFFPDQLQQMRRLYQELLPASQPIRWPGKPERTAVEAKKEMLS